MRGYSRDMIKFFKVSKECLMNQVRSGLKFSKSSGFTLIELLVVIIIIGILAGIAVIGVSGARNAAQERACLADATQLVKGIRAYSAANDLKFPKGTTATADISLPPTGVDFYKFSMAASGGVVTGDLAKLWNDSANKFIEAQLSSLVKATSTNGLSSNGYVLLAGFDENRNIAVIGYDDTTDPTPDLQYVAASKQITLTDDTAEFGGEGSCTARG